MPFCSSGGSFPRSGTVQVRFRRKQIDSYRRYYNFVHPSASNTLAHQDDHTHSQLSDRWLRFLFLLFINLFGSNSQASPPGNFSDSTRISCSSGGWNGKDCTKGHRSTCLLTLRRNAGIATMCLFDSKNCTHFVTILRRSHSSDISPIWTYYTLDSEVYHVVTGFTSVIDQVHFAFF